MVVPPELCYYYIGNEQMERRNEPRYPLTCEMEAVPSRLGTKDEHSRIVGGKVVNISAGGACVLADRDFDQSSILVCRVRFSGVPVAIPLLMQVRWTRPAQSPEAVLQMGLSFLA